PAVANGIGRSIVALTTANIAALAPSTSVRVPAQARKYALRWSNERQAWRSSRANVSMTTTVSPGFSDATVRFLHRIMNGIHEPATPMRCRSRRFVGWEAPDMRELTHEHDREETFMHSIGHRP